MSAEPPHICASMEYVLGEPALLLSYDDKFREYVMTYLSDTTQRMSMTFCPFCGALLPASLRKEWFEYFWSRDLDPHEDPVPPAMRSGQWWREAGL